MRRHSIFLEGSCPPLGSMRYPKEPQGAQKPPRAGMVDLRHACITTPLRRWLPEDQTRRPDIIAASIPRRG